MWMHTSLSDPLLNSTIFYRAHPGGAACRLTDAGSYLTKKKRRSPLFQGTFFYNVPANTWLEIAGFDPLSKHGLDLGLF